MASAMHLNTLMSQMFATGLLDDQFHQLTMLKATSGPDFVAELITIFCNDGRETIGELAKLLEQPCVDFEKVIAFVHRLKGASTTVGAKKVKNTCIELHVRCQEKSKDGCLKTLDAMANDFYDLCSKFHTMIQLEKQVQAFYAKQ